MTVRSILLAAALIAAPLSACSPEQAKTPSVATEADRMTLAREVVTSMNFASIVRDTMGASIAGANPGDPNADRRAKALAAAVDDVAPQINEKIAKVYADNLTPQVLAALGAFNRSPAGQAFIHKLPAAQKLMSQPGTITPVADQERMTLAKELVTLIDLRRQLTGGPLAAMLGGDDAASKARLDTMVTELEAKAVPAYATLYSTDELKGAIAFYKTPEGAEFNRRSTELQMAAMPAMFSVMPALLEATEKHYCASGPCTDKDHQEFAQAKAMMEGMAARLPAKPAAQSGAPAQ